MVVRHRGSSHSTAGRIRLIEKSNNLIGNRTRNLPAYSTVPKLTTLPRARPYLVRAVQSPLIVTLGPKSSRLGPSWYLSGLSMLKMSTPSESEALTKMEVVGSEVLFWDLTPCGPFKVNRRFRGTFCIHFHGRRMSQTGTQRESKKQAVCRFSAYYTVVYPRW
jgi:hypothetical protein